MNKKAIQFKTYRLLQKIDFKDRTGNKEGYVKIYPNNTETHETIKFQIALKLKKDKFKVYTECSFVDGSGRADLIAIAPNGNGYIIEVLCSETEERYLEKEAKYPKEFDIIKVKAKDFNIDEFKL